MSYKEIVKEIVLTEYGNLVATFTGNQYKRAWNQIVPVQNFFPMYS